MAKVPKSAPPVSEIISAREAADLLMLESTRRVQQLADEGYFERAARGKYVRTSVVHGYIRFLKEGIKDRNANTHVNRVQDAKAKQIEIANARSEHRLVDIDEADAVVMEIAGILKSGFSGYPARMTRDMTMRNKLEAGINEIFTRANDRILETLSALRESGEVVDADSEDDA